MSATHYLQQPEHEQASPMRRALMFALAVAIEVLLLLALLTIDFRDKPRPEFKGGSIATFDIANAEETDTSKAEPQAQATRPPERPALPAVKPEIKLPPRPIDLLIMSKEELEAADIARLGSNAPGGGRMAGAPGDSEMVGTGPNGEPLYAAEWYREPTNQELSTYMPKHLNEDGWGMVACKTVARFRVEDCVELGQTPGSHLAGAVRQAAWQFLVRPPRVGGKSMVGTWVRIRIDYTVTRRPD